MFTSARLLAASPKTAATIGIALCLTGSLVGYSISAAASTPGHTLVHASATANTEWEPLMFDAPPKPMWRSGGPRSAAAPVKAIKHVGPPPAWTTGPTVPNASTPLPDTSQSTASGVRPAPSRTSPAGETSSMASVIAQAVLARLNGERAANHLPGLRMNSDLISSAHTHNVAMARDNTMSHQLPGEPSFGDRILAAGYNYHYAAENVGWNSDETEQGALDLQDVMYNETPPHDEHRHNILGTNYVDVGIDIYFDSVHHKLWMTEDFGTSF